MAGVISWPGVLGFWAVGGDSLFLGSGWDAWTYGSLLASYCVSSTWVAGLSSWAIVRWVWVCFFGVEKVAKLIPAWKTRDFVDSFTFRIIYSQVLILW